MTSKPAPSSALRLVEGSSIGSRPGRATLRRLQKSGWISTGTFGLRNSPTSPSIRSCGPSGRG